jgi:DNA-binding LytR/AlgR family response regulator
VISASLIAVDWGATTEVISWSEVITVNSVGNHTELATPGRELRVRCPLKTIVATLAPLGLIQVRRDVAVNSNRVRRIIGAGGHRLLLVLDGGACIRVGRQFQSDMRARFALRPR